MPRRICWRCDWVRVNRSSCLWVAENPHQPHITIPHSRSQSITQTRLAARRPVSAPIVQLTAASRDPVAHTSAQTRHGTHGEQAQHCGCVRKRGACPTGGAWSWELGCMHAAGAAACLPAQRTSRHAYMPAVPVWCPDGTLLARWLPGSPRHPFCTTTRATGLPLLLALPPHGSCCACRPPCRQTQAPSVSATHHTITHNTPAHAHTHATRAAPRNSAEGAPPEGHLRHGQAGHLPAPDCGPKREDLRRVQGCAAVRASLCLRGGSAGAA
jgi:hypothetical protein